MEQTKLVNWAAKLTRSLTLTNGDTLVTLEDARRLVLAYLTTEVEHFDLANAMRLLLTAAEKGSVANRKAATEQVAIVLRARRLLAATGAGHFRISWRSGFALDADPPPLALGHVVFLDGAPDGFFAVPASAREGQALGLALQHEDAQRGWRTSLGRFMGAKMARLSRNPVP